MDIHSTSVRGDPEAWAASIDEGRVGRKVGYLVTVLIDGVLLFLVNVRPGWDAVPFLAGSFSEVLALVNLSLVAPIALNLVYLVVDPPWFLAAGQVVMSVITFVVAVALLQVFPFDFAANADWWELVTRIVLWIVAVGSAVAFLVSCGRLLRAVIAPAPTART